MKGLVNPFAAIFSVLKHGFAWNSRARRGEYWWTIVWLLAVVIIAALIDSQFFADETQRGALYSALTALFVIFYLPALYFMICVTVRRLHDLDMSGWYVLIYFVPLGLGFIFMGIICSRKGTAGPNKYGPDPLYEDVFSEVEEFG